MLRHFSHVPSERRTKLDPTTQQGILVGYSEVSKAYRIYIPPLRKVVVSRDVRFEEDRAFARSLESSRADEVDAELPDCSLRGSTASVVRDTIFRGDRVTMHSFRVTVQHVQSDGAQTSERGQTSGSQSVAASPEAITLGQRDLTSPLTTSGKRRPRWFQETLKEAIENVGEPKRSGQTEEATSQIGSILGTSDYCQG
jgi:hypothetical protein